jgi:hypothetical protein
MDHVGIDVHKRESQICVSAEGGELIEQRIRTQPDRFAAVLGRRPRARILIETSTESEWVSRCLEGLGHEVIVADPNFGLMYATRTRKVKTDRRDARALPDANLLGAYRPAHRLSDAKRHVRGRLGGRDAEEEVDIKALWRGRGGRARRGPRHRDVICQPRTPAAAPGAPMAQRRAGLGARRRRCNRRRRRAESAPRSARRIRPGEGRRRTRVRLWGARPLSSEAYARGGRPL